MSARLIERLKAAHERINKQIEFENSLLQPDEARLSKLKKTKLSLKDRMTRISASLVI
ncbi:hypothetical protein BSL82_05020 [Tardibacter chloracetimidivorans]|uniref:DUF465 domain-containing protein n=1 Tax=Tardibacter chloracetimidivorans TaxID=1921510 RepID=A0A1L3ZT01_9SPHN|nr:DUF465 domain-containing protein [Tardibacter chloracetimidivorans]API58754.1 hypothetical protein BSL82_05020 [Tardibacter chloracetimidivorans]